MTAGKSGLRPGLSWFDSRALLLSVSPRPCWPPLNDLPPPPLSLNTEHPVPLPAARTPTVGPRCQNRPRAQGGPRRRARPPAAEPWPPAPPVTTGCPLGALGPPPPATPPAGEPRGPRCVSGWSSSRQDQSGEANARVCEPRAPAGTRTPQGTCRVWTAPSAAQPRVDFTRWRPCPGL